MITPCAESRYKDVALAYALAHCALTSLLEINTQINSMVSFLKLYYVVRYEFLYVVYEGGVYFTERKRNASTGVVGKSVRGILCPGDTLS